MIDFRAEKELARLHDPRQSFALAEVEAEVRYHPLTGESARHWLAAHVVPRLWLDPRLHVGDPSHFHR